MRYGFRVPVLLAYVALFPVLNFGFSADDDRRRFLFNIHGGAGVGKAFLTRQLRQIAAAAGALTAYVDETAEDETSAMSSMASEFSRAGSRLGEFEKRAAEYQRHGPKWNPILARLLALPIFSPRLRIGNLNRPARSPRSISRFRAC